MRLIFSLILITMLISCGDKAQNVEQLEVKPSRQETVDFITSTIPFGGGKFSQGDTHFSYRFTCDVAEIDLDSVDFETRKNENNVYFIVFTAKPGKSIREWCVTKEKYGHGCPTESKIEYDISLGDNPNAPKVADAFKHLVNLNKNRNNNIKF